MDSKLLIVKIVTLLYKEHVLQEENPATPDLVKEALGNVQLPEGGGEYNSGRDILISLIATINWMLEETEPYDQSSLLQRIRINTEQDQFLFDAIKDAITFQETEEQRKHSCLILRSELRNVIYGEKIKGVIKGAYRDTHSYIEGFNSKKVAKHLINQLTPYVEHSAEEKIEGEIDGVDFLKEEGTASIIEQSVNEALNGGFLKTGWQALNRMLGPNGGFRRGETCVIGALQYNFKTGMLLSLLCHFALHNKPPPSDSNKKPLLLFMTTENDLHVNIMWVYRHLKENDTKEAVNINNVSPIEAASYIRQRLGNNGYQIKMFRYDPSSTSFQSYLDLIAKCEAEGYEVHAALVDYLNMFNKKGMTHGHGGFEVRDLWRRFRNYNNVKNILGISPHQISPEGKRLTRMDIEDFVKNIANKGYYDSCSTIDQEVDLEIYIHIVKVNGKSYLTMQRGKHRGSNITPEKDLYAVMPFYTVGNIPDDIDSKDISMRYPGADQLGGDDVENPWYKM